jgi:hypothetical protein
VRIKEYDTRPACLEGLGIAERIFRTLETTVPPAQWVPWEGDYNWRFVEQLPQQLLLQKLAREITGIHAFDILLRAGQLQEVGVLYRSLDEVHEDILFVALGLKTGNWTTHHDAYCRYFWSEDELDSQPPVRRKTIRAYVNRALGQPNPSQADAVGRIIHKTFSDYIHARSAPIMAMVHGPPARFDLSGILDDGPRFPYILQSPMYSYRCLVSASIMANAMLPRAVSSRVYADIKDFEKRHSELLF